MKRAAVLFVLLAALLPIGSRQADAAIGCGSVIRHSVKLTTDVGPCGAGNAITIRGRRIKFDLGGHTIRGMGLANSNGIVVDQGSKKVSVRNGTIANFDDGLVVFGSKNSVSDIVSHDSVLGVVWSALGGSMIRTRAFGNGTAGLDVSFPAAGAVIRDFSAIDNNNGALVGRPVTITNSFFTNNSANGLFASGPNIVLRGNYFNHNAMIGLDAIGDSEVIGSNIANYNGTWGMVAPDSVIDLGGDLAKENGTPAQCNNVSCN